MYFLLHVFAFRSKKSKMLNAGLLLVTECFHIDVTSALSFFFLNDFFHYFERKKRERDKNIKCPFKVHLLYRCIVFQSEPSVNNYH